MFVSDFKKIQIKGKSYPSKVTMYRWDQKTEKLKKETFDWQVEINKNKHVDLKEMLKKNLVPETTKKGTYGDITGFKNVDIHKVYRAVTSNVMFGTKDEKKTTKEPVVENKESEKKEQSPTNEKKD